MLQYKKGVLQLGGTCREKAEEDGARLFRLSFMCGRPVISGLSFSAGRRIS